MASNNIPPGYRVGTYTDGYEDGYRAAESAARASADRGLAGENERYRKALEAIHRYGLMVLGASAAYGEQESKHLWLEVAAMAETALWPDAALSSSIAVPEGVGSADEMETHPFRPSTVVGEDRCAALNLEQQP